MADSMTGGYNKERKIYSSDTTGATVRDSYHTTAATATPMSDFNKFNFDALANSVTELESAVEEAFDPQIVAPGNYREFTIPKKSGKTRKICAPNEILKRAQQRALADLYKEYQRHIKGTVIEDVCHGFIPGRNVVTAAQKHVGFKNTTMLDISEFFDTVSRDMLPGGIGEDDLFFHENGYCAQGFVTSPILACIASNGLVEGIAERLRVHFTPKDYAFTMYADDIQISLSEDNLEWLKVIKQIVKEEVESAGFKLNESKTRTKFAKFGWRRILGVNVGDKTVRATRKTMRKIRAARHGGHGSSLGGLVTWSKCALPRAKKAPGKRVDNRSFKKKQQSSAHGKSSVDDLFADLRIPSEQVQDVESCTL